MGIVDAYLAHAISLVVTIRNVIFDVRIKLLQESVYQRHGRASINVIVAIHQDALLTPHRVVQPVNRHVHVFHQERVVKVGQLWMEETLRSALGSDATAYQQIG